MGLEPHHPIMRMLWCHGGRTKSKKERVREPVVLKYKKLARFVKKIKGTIGIPLILSMDTSGHIKWYVNAAFPVHKGIRRHTGGFTTMGNSGSYVQSIKKN